ncbi:MAG: EamA family transporter [Deltaproteobacteria bacterium]|jgi:transporter family protein|nr:EamA family transporter [Deltaproteobacteria bacterium]
MPSWLILSISTFVLWGLWGLFAKIASETIDAKSTAVMQAIGALIVTLGLAATMRFKLEWHASGTTAALFAGFALMLGLIAVSAALAGGGKASIVVPITALYPVVAIALGVTFLSESVSPTQASGIGLALVGIVLMSR